MLTSIQASYKSPSEFLRSSEISLMMWKKGKVLVLLCGGSLHMTPADLGSAAEGRWRAHFFSRWVAACSPSCAFFFSSPLQRVWSPLRVHAATERRKAVGSAQPHPSLSLSLSRSPSLSPSSILKIQKLRLLQPQRQFIIQDAHVYFMAPTPACNLWPHSCCLLSLTTEASREFPNAWFQHLSCAARVRTHRSLQHCFIRRTIPLNKQKEAELRL